MRPPRSSLRDSVTNALGYGLTVFWWVVELTRDATAWVWQLLRSLTARGRSHARTALAVGRRLLGGPLRRMVTGPVRTVVVGRRSVVSVLAGLLTAPLALATAWWVDASVGYGTLVELVLGTWNGTNPELGVFLAAAVLIGLGAVSAALNSGLLPTSALVVAPVFGAALTRYGTTVTTYDGGTAVVSLPEAVAYAASVGVVIGAPIAVAGFLLGSALRRLGVVVAGSGGPSRPTEQA